MSLPDYEGKYYSDSDQDEPDIPSKQSLQVQGKYSPAADP
jgi:hypothetical protein